MSNLQHLQHEFITSGRRLDDMMQAGLETVRGGGIVVNVVQIGWNQDESTMFEALVKYEPNALEGLFSLIGFDEEIGISYFPNGLSCALRWDHLSQATRLFLFPSADIYKREIPRIIELNTVPDASDIHVVTSNQLPSPHEVNLLAALLPSRIVSAAERL